MLSHILLGALVGSVSATINAEDLYVGAYEGPATHGKSVPNMNGDYPNPINALPGFKSVHRGEYFEVYGHPVTNRYSEIFWTAQPSIPLPEDFVKRWDNRTISITGFEVDIVRYGNTSKEMSVPSYQWYNHHYCVALRGKASEMVYVGRRTKTEGVTRRAIERNPPEYEPRSANDDNPSSPVPTAQMFWQGNGGEHRKSFKHYAKGYGQFLESPAEFWLQPMLINTHGPDGETKHVSGPISRNSYGQEPNQTINRKYSPMMECPCTDRLPRVFSGYTTTVTDTCGNLTMTNAKSCFAAVAQLTGVAGHGGGMVTKNTTSAATGNPAGCFMIMHTEHEVETIEAVFNTASASGTQCGVTDGRPVRSMGSSTKAVAVHLDLDEATHNATITLEGPADVWYGVGFNAQLMNDLPYTITVEADGTVTERKLANHVGGSVLAKQLEVLSSVVKKPLPTVIQHMNHYGAPFVNIGPKDDAASCQAACEANATCAAWTFNARAQSSKPYDVVAEASCFLRFSLCVHGSGSSPCGFTPTAATTGMTSGVASREMNQTRTVVLRRALQGMDQDHYTFTPTQSSLNFIEAVGTTPNFVYHGPIRSGSTLMMVEAGAPLCVCRAEQMGGSIAGVPWRNDCAAFPASTVGRDHNPSCSIETYGGGMKCCMNGMQLLDSDQEIPPAVDTVQMKWRFYYEEPDNATQNAFFLFFETEANHGEYDVPKCAAGTPASECVHEIRAKVQLEKTGRACEDRADPWCAPAVGGSYPQADADGLAFFKFVHISPHCHGPSCISMELIDNDRNETICKVHPVYGVGDAAMNESGYAAGILPCLWGSAEEGLELPPVFPAGANVSAIKRSNSTLKHFGVMAHWQMRAVWATEREYHEYRAYVDARNAEQIAEGRSI